MGNSVTQELLSDMIRQYFSQERPEEETIQTLNNLRRVLHEVSPFAQEPVDCVLWVNVMNASQLFEYEAGVGRKSVEPRRFPAL